MKQELTNATQNKERSSSTENDCDCAPAAGVGGRQKETHTPLTGGGYLDICTEIDSRIEKNVDPRLDELCDMGLGQLWIHIAKHIGVDAFLFVWQVLDKKNISAPPGCYDKARIRVPQFSRYIHYQRNKVIVALSNEGLSTKEIQKRIKTDLCEDITVRHIQRIIKRCKIKA